MHKNLVIIGGGFAGIKAAQELEHALPTNWNLTLISQENFITFKPLLPEVVGASILPGHVIAPHRQMIHCSQVCMAQVTHIDTVEQVIHYLGEGVGTFRYDQLVLACGSNANLDIVKGMARYALPLKTLGDALFLRNRIIARLEQAELQPNPLHRGWLTTFVIVGGGFSGVETAGELVDFLYASLRYYKRIRCEDLRIVLLHSGERLLPELSASLGDFTLRKMRKRGVQVYLNARAALVTDRAVHLGSGEIIAGGTVICTIGTQPNPLVDELPALKSRGRVVVMRIFRCPVLQASGPPGTVPRRSMHSTVRSRRRPRSSPKRRPGCSLPTLWRIFRANPPARFTTSQGGSSPRLDTTTPWRRSTASSCQVLLRGSCGAVCICCECPRSRGRRGYSSNGTGPCFFHRTFPTWDTGAPSDAHRRRRAQPQVQTPKTLLFQPSPEAR
jgi:NADH dehydrogenase FAD-containing subunit